MMHQEVTAFDRLRLASAHRQLERLRQEEADRLNRRVEWWSGVVLVVLVPVVLVGMMVL